jgi:hypothetical protein
MSELPWACPSNQEVVTNSAKRPQYLIALETNHSHAAYTLPPSLHDPDSIFLFEPDTEMNTVYIHHQLCIWYVGYACDQTAK